MDARARRHIDVLLLAKKHFDSFLDEAIGMIGYDDDAGQRQLLDHALGTLPTRVTWTEVEERNDESQRWPDGSLEHYLRFTVYRGSGDFDGVTCALGDAAAEDGSGGVVGFLVGSSGRTKRPLTVFFRTDDYEETNELASIIRGKGGGRATFRPDDELPALYAALKTGVLAERVRGKWNARAVIATNDQEGRSDMLTHTAIQARLRGLT